MSKKLILSLVAIMVSSCSHLPSPPAPKAAEKPKTLEKFGDKREDPYYWMNERTNPEVIHYLNAENEYTEAMLAPVKDLQEELFQEFRSRIKEDDSTYPYQDGEYFYYSRYELGKEYPIYARKKGSVDGPEEILLNVNEMSRGHAYYSVRFPVPSRDHTKIIYAVDAQGRRFYDLYVKDLVTGQVVGTPIEKTTGNAVWANDNRTFFYTKQDEKTLRSQWAFRHKLGEKKSSLVYEEKDEMFYLAVDKSKTDQFIFFVSNASESTEYRVLDAWKPNENPRVFLPREKKHEYSIEDGVDGFYVLSNWSAKNFRLLKAPRRPAQKSEWVELVPNREDVYLDSFDIFASHLALVERKDGLKHIRLIHRESSESVSIAFPDPTYVVSLGDNARYDTTFVRYEYESLNRPETIYDYDLATRASTVRKVRPTPNLSPDQYVSERVWAPARDGTRIPVSLVYKKGVDLEDAPLLQYGYGSYGYSMDAGFGITYFSLLDRGFVYAIAHIRGGSEMGRYWYEDAKFLKKKNTFNDFVDVTEFLGRGKYCDPKQVYAMGGSAGGLLMGAVINMRPDLYKGVVAAVPFVDVVTTMLDDSLPLTAFEYDEWGNPNKREYYDYMKSYSPYDNVTAQAYPHLLVTSGLHDSQVQYFEPTKWVAKLRKMKVGESLLLLRTEMEAGHGGASGRFQRLKETAREYGFILHVRDSL